MAKALPMKPPVVLEPRCLSSTHFHSHRTESPLPVSKPHVQLVGLHSRTSLWLLSLEAASGVTGGLGT